MITIGPAVFGIYRIARAKYDKCTKHCGVFNINTFRRQMCMTKCKLDNLKNEILPNLKRIKSSCNKSKNPEKCNRKADEEIRKIEKRIVKSEIKWRDIQNQAKIRGFENTERHTKIDPSSKKWNLFRKYEK